MSPKSKPGDPRKQPRPDGREPGDEVTQTFPPSFSGVLTEFGAECVTFPFVGGKAVQLEAKCGALTLNLILEPGFADKVCGLIEQAAAQAQSPITPASLADVKALAGNGSK